ncbi:MAG: DUF4232 domain-containing protein [Acidimicrobiia bacterium]|nr:DUF4232 domain-containing protein [Acidimicrobiia bacterium]
MTDRIDYRLEELVNQLAASAPEAPPFPQAAIHHPVKSRRLPGWALAAAGAAAVLIIIGLPFLIFGGGTADQDVATTFGSTPTTQVPPPTTTPTAPVTAACTPPGLLVRALEQDGAAGHVVTPIRFTNVSGSPCTLDDPLGVTGIGEGGEEIAANLGTSVPIGGDPDPVVKAGDSLVMFVEVGTACDAGRPVGPKAEAVRVALATGEVTVDFSGDLGCNFSYSLFGIWLEAEPLSAGEQALALSLRQFASGRSAEQHAAIPFSDTVTLTLGPALATTRSAADLADESAWSIDEGAEGFRAYVGPFSALDLLAQPRDVMVAAGPHDHCAGPPMPTHADLQGLRQISIQPTDATSCLEWWVVDLFLTESAEIAGVTLDLWEP